MKIDERKENLAHPQLSVRSVIIEDNRVLMVEHFHNDHRGRFWVLPGGGVEKNESIVQAVIRETQEETGILCNPTGIVHVREVEMFNIRGIEIYVLCRKTQGELTVSRDHDDDERVIQNCRWVSAHELKNLRFYPESLQELLPDWLESVKVPIIELPANFKLR